MKLERGLLKVLTIKAVLIVNHELTRTFEPMIKVFLRHLGGFGGCQIAGTCEFAVVRLVQHDAVAPDVREEVLALRERLVDLLECVNEQADRGLNLKRDPVFGGAPDFPLVDQLGPIQDHQDVVVAQVSVRRILDPTTRRVAAKQDDLE